MEKLSKDTLCCIADHLSPTDFHSYRLIAKIFNEAVKKSPAEWRCRVQVQSTFIPRKDVPGIRSYKEIYEKIGELNERGIEMWKRQVNRNSVNTELILKTPRLYTYFLSPDERGSTVRGSEFLQYAIRCKPFSMSIILNTKALYRTYLRYVHPTATRNLALGNKAFFICVLKKKRLLKSMYRPYDNNGKSDHNVYYLHSVFLHYPETVQFAEKVRLIVALHDKFKKLKKIAKQSIPRLEATLTEEERSYLKP